MLIILGLLAGLLLALAALFVRNLEPAAPPAPPPWANSLLVETYAGAELSPWQFIAQNEYTARNRFMPTFAQQPDTSLYSQEQNVFILLTNDEGETQTIISVLRIVEDGVPPVFSGIRDEIHVGRGSTVAFRQGVTVSHSSGQATFEVDSSAVDTSTPGTYEVVFIARTPMGQESRATSRVVVSAATQEQALALVQPILDQHIRPDMTQAEKARAIFNWARWNIQYAVGGTHGDVLESVVQGMTRRRGDCYVFYAVTRFMLEQVGIPSISMRRYPIVNARHVWLLLDFGDGWHHVDPTPNQQNLPNDGFMFTQAQAQQFSNQRPGFFSFNPAILPEGVVIQ
ncbi:MAG: transglutaminase-like domain-containing protein [Oscillospiraceae bacterium]|nr:transglutaminase-like domain-containing protein [Oscillospiraceae bacterium]